MNVKLLIDGEMWISQYLMPSRLPLIVSRYFNVHVSGLVDNSFDSKIVKSIEKVCSGTNNGLIFKKQRKSIFLCINSILVTSNLIGSRLISLCCSTIKS